MRFACLILPALLLAQQPDTLEQADEAFRQGDLARSAASVLHPATAWSRHLARTDPTEPIFTQRSFVEKNVGKDPQARQELMEIGITSLPVLLIGDQKLAGFNPAKIDEALALLK